MCEFITPPYIYYSHITVIILCLVTALMVLLKNIKKASNRNAFYFISLIALWIANVLGQWTVHDEELNRLVVKVSVLMSDLILLFFLYFSYYYSYAKLNLGKKILLAVPCATLLILAFSRYNIQFFDANTCNYVHTKFISFYVYFFEIFYAVLSTNVLIKYYRDPTQFYLAKKQIKVLLGAVWFFVIWDIFHEEIARVSFLAGPYLDNTPHFIAGNLFFVSLIAFAIVKNELFEFNGIITAGFTVILWSLIFAGLFFFHFTAGFAIMFFLFYLILMYVFWKM